MTVTHEVSYLKTEGVVTGWCCTCGQSSGPWQTKAIINQQMERHVEEWTTYEESLARIELERISRCGHCKKKLVAKSRIDVGDVAYHRNCLRKVLDAGDSQCVNARRS